MLFILIVNIILYYNEFLIIIIIIIKMKLCLIKEIIKAGIALVISLYIMAVSTVILEYNQTESNKEFKA